MSIKIYDAYRMKAVSPEELQTFVKLIRNHCIDCISKEYVKAIAVTVGKITDLVTIYQKQKTLFQDTDIHVPEYIEDLYMKATPTGFILNQFPKPVQMPTYEMDCLNLAKAFIENHTQAKTITGAPLPIHTENSIVFFPLHPNTILFQVFGHWATTFLQDIAASRPGQPLHVYKDTYQIEDYYYQNAVDKPTDISDTDWELRKIHWDRVMPTGFPSVDGISVTLTDFDLYTNPYYTVKRNMHLITNVLKRTLSKEKRSQKLAYEILLQTESHHLSSQTPSAYYDLSDNIRNAIYNKDASSPYYQNYQKLTKKLNQILKDITIDVLQEPVPILQTTKEEA